jgi:hypothetical protein
MSLDGPLTGVMGLNAGTDGGQAISVGGGEGVVSSLVEACSGVPQIGIKQLARWAILVLCAVQSVGR